MRLDPSYLQFITKQQLRILVAIQIGMKNHEYVPLELIASIGNLRSGQTFKTIRKLLKVKLIVHVGKKNNGYKLTYLGYDYLALHAFMKRGIVKEVVCKIGVGKQSDIYKCLSFDGAQIVLKLTRLGRRSFKTIKNNREYIQGRTSFNWLYLSRLSSIRQFAFMQILYEDGFPTPRPIDTNRHAIVMSLIDGDPLCNVKKIGQECSVKSIFLNTLELVQKFASRGLIHGDFNQFNLLINNSGKLTVIDFPQCISSNHINAQQYFNRDVECLYVFFDKLLHKSMRQQSDGKVYINENDVGFNLAQVPMPVLSEIKVEKRLDLQVRAKGHFKLSEEKQLDQFMKEWNQFRITGKNAQEKQVEQEQQEQECNQQQLDQQLQISEEQFNKQCQQSLDQNKQDHVNKLMQLDQNDEDIKELIGELKQIQIIQSKQVQKVSQQVQKQTNQEQNQQSQSSQQQNNGQGIKMRPQWKGLTSFQIRQILKQQRKKAREEKKAQMSTQQYIKRALYRNKNKKQVRTHVSKGNYGAKAKTKANTQNIKQGMELGW